MFDYQRHVAARFGYGDQEGVQLGVERFMKHYYRMAMELRQLNEMLLQLFREAILESQREARIEPLNKRFQVRNGYLDACHDQVFERYPCALLEVFLLLQQHPRDRRRTRQHHPLNPRPPSSHRRQVPQEPQVARVVHGDHPPAAWHRP